MNYLHPGFVIAINLNKTKNIFMKKRLFSVAIAAGATLLMLTSCNESKTDTTETTMGADTTAKMETPMPAEETGVMVGGANMVPSKNIVENAAGSSDHTTLVAAVKQADLAGTLSGAGPFTVFAPTNEAFDKVPAETLKSLMTPEKKDALTKILTFHVVPGALKAADLKDGMMLKTVQGQELKVTVKDGKTMINGAEVTIADVISSNGVTHVINAVLMPK